MAKLKSPKSEDPNASKKGARKVRKPRRKTKGALAAIGFLLLTSAVLRAAIGATEALAADGGDAKDPNTAHVSDHAEAPVLHSDKSGQDHNPARVVAEADIVPLIAALDARESRVAKRERDIEIRMQALSVAEQEIERKLAALIDAEDTLRATLTLAQDAAENDIAQLTEVYANMKPKQAAALFEQMDPQFAAGFLGRMRPDAAAAILAGLTPNSAYTISVVLAGRNAEVPRE